MNYVVIRGEEVGGVPLWDITRVYPELKSDIPKLVEWAKIAGPGDWMRLPDGHGIVVQVGIRSGGWDYAILRPLSPNDDTATIESLEAERRELIAKKDMLTQEARTIQTQMEAERMAKVMGETPLRDPGWRCKASFALSTKRSQVDSIMARLAVIRSLRADIESKERRERGDYSNPQKEAAVKILYELATEVDDCLDDLPEEFRRNLDDILTRLDEVDPDWAGVEEDSTEDTLEVPNEP